MRRQLAKGFVLLNKEAWTPQADYRSSLALRSERTVVDSSVPYALRLEQIYRPAIELTPALTTKVTIRKRVPPARAGAPAARHRRRSTRARHVRRHQPRPARIAVRDGARSERRRRRSRW